MRSHCWVSGVGIDAGETCGAVVLEVNSVLQCAKEYVSKGSEVTLSGQQWQCVTSIFWHVETSLAYWAL